jgi:hypothetical protein
VAVRTHNIKVSPPFDSRQTENNNLEPSAIRKLFAVWRTNTVRCRTASGIGFDEKDVPEKEVAEAREKAEYKEAYDAIGAALGKVPKDQAVKACTTLLESK